MQSKWSRTEHVHSFMGSFNLFTLKKLILTPNKGQSNIYRSGKNWKHILMLLLRQEAVDASRAFLTTRQGLQVWKAQVNEKMRDSECFFCFGWSLKWFSRGFWNWFGILYWSFRGVLQLTVSLWDDLGCVQYMCNVCHTGFRCPNNITYTECICIYI